MHWTGSNLLHSRRVAIILHTGSSGCRNLLLQSLGVGVAALEEQVGVAAVKGQVGRTALEDQVGVAAVKGQMGRTALEDQVGGAALEDQVGVAAVKGKVGGAEAAELELLHH